MELKIDESAVKDVVAAAIMEQLGVEGRERLISAALTYLLTDPPKPQYGQASPSPLQQAFNMAAGVAAREIVQKEVAESPEFIAKVREHVGAAMAKIDEAEYTSYVADALAAAMRDKSQ